jgi:hypothetical protein
MTGIVTYIPQLTKDEGQECGVGQLEPEIIYDYQKRYAEGQQS